MKRFASWLVLFIGGLVEVALFVSLKLSEGFTKLYPTLLVVLFATTGYFLLQMAKKSISPVAAYSVYSCIGLVGIVYVGITAFSEGLSWSKLIFLWLLFIGIMGFYASDVNATKNEEDS